MLKVSCFKLTFSTIRIGQLWLENADRKVYKFMEYTKLSRTRNANGHFELTTTEKKGKQRNKFGKGSLLSHHPVGMGNTV